MIKMRHNPSPVTHALIHSHTHIVEQYHNIQDKKFLTNKLQSVCAIKVFMNKARDEPYLNNHCNQNCQFCIQNSVNNKDSKAFIYIFKSFE